ncbi:MAG: PHB depolymerase family esterase [Pseudomonadota bacterium]
MKIVALSAALAAFCAFGASACSTTMACSVDEGEYFMAMPKDATPDERHPAVVYLHGFGGSGSGVFRNTGMTSSFTDRGYVLAAPMGLLRNGRARGWFFHPDRNGDRDEIAFLTAVRDDLVANHNVDPNRIILTGFSIGGSMTAYFACASPETFAAYTPLGGNFWRPHPEACEGPVRMFHTHGWRDGTVPLEGRYIRGQGLDPDDPNAFVQGDIFQAMQIWREANGCVNLKADSFATTGDYMRRAWDRCTPGSALELAIFPGGHVIPQGWADLTLDWFEGL